MTDNFEEKYCNIPYGFVPEPELVFENVFAAEKIIQMGANVKQKFNVVGETTTVHYIKFYTSESLGYDEVETIQELLKIGGEYCRVRLISANGMLVHLDDIDLIRPTDFFKRCTK